MKKYQVTAFARNTWSQDSDGTCHRVIERDCGHKHRTLAGACRCHQSLTRHLADGLYSADWYHAEITYTGGERLTASDEDAVEVLL